MKTLDEKRDELAIDHLEKYKGFDPRAFSFAAGWDACAQELTKLLDEKDRVIENLKYSLEQVLCCPYRKPCPDCIEFISQALEQAEKLKGNE
jgi:hypothetical protein